ncbi:MAG: DUF2807 domain-containing protein [Bacteroidota bacterium]|nr:DUF2807 domain-containing protein [Bacteroidota bacterium]
MKNICLFLSLLLVNSVFAQWPWEKIEGNGHVVRETRSLSGFSAVSSSGSWDVMIAYGQSNSIEVEGDENLLPYIETQVINGKLLIGSTKHSNLRSKNKITLYITMTKVTGISLSGSGDIIGNGKFGNEGTTDFKLSGSGSIRLDFQKIRDVNLAISGSGNIRLSGSAESVRTKISGSGNIDCSQLISDRVVAYVSGSGNTKVNANTSLEAHISGSGNIYYSGAAGSLQKHVSGSGRVIKS